MPSFNKLLGPVLKAHQGGEKHVQEICDEVAQILNLTEEEKRALVSSSRRITKLRYRVGWAKTYLSNTGLIKSTRRGYSDLTSRGQEVLQSNVEVDRKFLKQFDPLREFKESEGKKSDDQNESLEIAQEDDDIPEEIIERNIKAINETLEQALLTRIQAEDPQFFENLIVDLLKAMGYGGREGMGGAIGKPGDRGVDGVIDQDVLGVDKIYCQAKRYAPENKVSGADIRDFSGALNLHGVTKGIFVTTSSFTPDARATAKNVNQNIILINGQELAELMIRYSVGCQKDKTYEIKKIDEDYFDSSI
ncbi:MAG: restriction endonuclease [Gammaproteobacteria bacterium AqS3]|nr:restriction endonuclease [Gammaproteobacteria bacterium AqS3]